MRILHTPSKISNIRPVLILGTFDGLHLGHLKVIEEAKNAVKTHFSGTPLAVFTFLQNPLAAINPAAAPPMLLERKTRRRLFAELGIDYLIEVDFTAELAASEPEEFIALLKETVNPVQIVVGENFTFGREARGNVENLPHLAKEYGIGNVKIVPLAVSPDGIVISSTRIRYAVKEGDLPSAARLLGRPYAIEGTVETGDRQGRVIGFPTANIALPDDLALPPNGAYAAYAKIAPSDEKIPAVAAITAKPTVKSCQRRLEVHLFNFNDIIYGKNLQTELIELIRLEKKFPDLNALKRQLTLDCGTAKRILSNGGVP